MNNVIKPNSWTLFKIAPSDQSNALIQEQDPAFIKDPVAVFSHAPVPGTVSNILLSDEDTASADDYIWCYEASFDVEQSEAQKVILNLEGLATLCEIWINDKRICRSDNMFVAHQLDITTQLCKRNNIKLVFHSLSDALNQKKSRPRWKTNLIHNQNLRWFRTTLLGRIPGWANAQAAIGPWKPVTIFTTSVPQIKKASVHAQVNTKDEGVIAVHAEFYHPNLHGKNNARFKLYDANKKLVYQQLIKPNINDGIFTFNETILVSQPELWWPHTHGEPYCYTYEITVEYNQGEAHLQNGLVGFRSLNLRDAHESPVFTINEENIFCRGGCWASLGFGLSDSYSETKVRTKKILVAAKQSGINMIRIGGTMVYEQAYFYEMCSELGILVWQDLMLANMDYPFSDTDFKINIEKEIKQNVNFISQYPALATICGGSEVAQQASMMGQPKSVWDGAIYNETIKQWVAEGAGESVTYLPASPNGGALPMQTDVGMAHYFGVGAYKRPLSDLWQAHVKFASECLAFANVPSEAFRKKYFTSALPQPHTPEWKKGICRDNAAGWDFSDVTDYYIEHFFNLNVNDLKYSNLDRYYRLQEVVVGEIASEVFNFWRSSKSACHGGLIWFLNDLIPGAGWGVFDSDGSPKPALNIVQQCFQSVQVVLVEQGLNGHYVEVINEQSETFEGDLTIQLISAEGELMHDAKIPLCVLPRTQKGWELNTLLDQFFDTAYAYKFGPIKAKIVAAVLTAKNTNVYVSQSVSFIDGYHLINHELSINAMIDKENDKNAFSVIANNFVQNLKITSKNCTVNTNYFHMLEGVTYPLDVVVEPVLFSRAKIVCESLNGEGVQRFALNAL